MHVRLVISFKDVCKRFIAGCRLLSLSARVFIHSITFFSVIFSLSFCFFSLSSMSAKSFSGFYGFHDVCVGSPVCCPFCEPPRVVRPVHRLSLLEPRAVGRTRVPNDNPLRVRSPTSLSITAETQHAGCRKWRIATARLRRPGQSRSLANTMARHAAGASRKTVWPVWSL